MRERLSGALGKLNIVSRFRDGERPDPVTAYLLITLAAAVLVAAISFWFYNRTHLFDDYRVTKSAQVQDVEGTLYARLGNRIIKYSHDGVFCVTTDNTTQWSAAYSMQTPIADISGGSMVIAEQQGNQVYVVNARGVLGSFQTTLPIMKARVSARGLVALVLKDDAVTWINIYTAEGSLVASVKTTVEDSGYPLDLALAPNARRMMVSFLGEEEGALTGRVAFYDFSNAEASDDSHLTGMLSYPGTVFPQVFYGSSQTPVAVADDGYILFKLGRNVSEKTRVTFQEEIVSTFYDEDNVGFVFRSHQPDQKYRLAIYNYNGKETMETEFAFDYTAIRMEDGEILLQNASNLYIYRTSGKQKLAVFYEKEVRYFDTVSGLRRYLVVTDSSMDRIRIR